MCNRAAAILVAARATRHNPEPARPVREKQRLSVSGGGADQPDIGSRCGIEFRAQLRPRDEARRERRDRDLDTRDERHGDQLRFPFRGQENGSRSFLDSTCPVRLSPVGGDGESRSPSAPHRAELWGSVRSVVRNRRSSAQCCYRLGLRRIGLVHGRYAIHHRHTAGHSHRWNLRAQRLHIERGVPASHSASFVLAGPGGEGDAVNEWYLLGAFDLCTSRVGAPQNDGFGRFI